MRLEFLRQLLNLHYFRWVSMKNLSISYANVVLLVVCTDIGSGSLCKQSNSVSCQIIPRQTLFY